MRSFIIFTLSLSLATTVYANVCTDTCFAAVSFSCFPDLACACQSRSFENQMAGCVANSLICDRKDLEDVDGICLGVGTSPSSTTPTGTSTTPRTQTSTETTGTPTPTTVGTTATTSTPSDTATSAPPVTTPSTPVIPPTTPVTPSTTSATSTSARTPTSSAYPTGFVYPGDTRLTYDPAAAWVDASSEARCNNGVRSSSTVGSSISFTFQGTGISFFTVPTSSSGNWSITIDNLKAEIVSGYNAQEALGACKTFVSWQKEGLALGQHKFSARLLDSGSVKRAAGTMYFAGLNYQGPSASNTTTTATPSDAPNPAIIGGAVGGAVGAIVILGLAIWIIRTRRRRNNWKGAEIDMPYSPSEHDLVAKPTLPSENLHNEKGYGATSGGYSDGQYGQGGYMSPYTDSPYAAAAAPVGSGRAGVGAGYHSNYEDNRADSQAYGAWQQQQQQPQQSSYGYSYPQQYAYGQYPAAAPSTQPSSQYGAPSRAPTQQWPNHEAARATPPPAPPAKMPPPPLAPTRDGGDMRAAAGQRTPGPRTPAPNEEDAYGGMEY